MEEHVGSGMFGLMKKGHSLPREPKKKPKRHKRLTPLRERAEWAGVLDHFKVTPPGLRERAEGGSAPAKTQLQALHKHNHQVVDRAEVAAASSIHVFACIRMYLHVFACIVMYRI